MKTQSFASFEDAAVGARQQCADGPVANLVLEVDLAVSSLKPPFNSAFLKEAESWQAKRCPSHLHINHGEYMNREGDSLGYILAQLKMKPTSRRAILSLVSSGDFIDSGDDPRPSFICFQAACLEASLETLHVSAYYRALEVVEFLPLNFTELAMMAESLVGEMPHVQRVNFVIHAFHAYASPGFRRLERGALNSAQRAEIESAVASGEADIVVGWVAAISGTDSVIELAGLVQLIEAFEIRGDAPKSEEYLNELLRQLAKLREFRTMASHGGRVDALTSIVDKLVDDARDSIYKELV